MSVVKKGADGMEQEHKRRVRYAGTHPRTFQEKYKELNPEKYQQEVEKLLRKGKTPAGMHIPICVEEILSFLEIQPGQIGWTPPWGTADTAAECWRRCGEGASLRHRCGPHRV